MELDRIYFARRAAEEKAAAMRTAHPNARSAHLDLAARYGDLAEHIGRSDRRAGVAAE